MNTEAIAKANHMIETYKKMQKKNPNSTMYQESMWQYADMAHGGDGGPNGNINGGSIRGEYYADLPDEFFFLVLSGLGEFERYLKSAGDPIGIP